MKKIVLICLAFLFSIATTTAQNNLPPVFEITADTALLDTLPNTYWQLLEDKEQKLRFEEIKKSTVAKRFHYDTTGKINYDIHTYWFRFSIRNVTNHEVKIGFYNIGEISDWYIISSDKTIHTTAGFWTPWRKKSESLKLISLSPFVMKEGETLIFYNRQHYNTNIFSPSYFYPRKFLFAYGFTDKVIQKYYVDDETHYFNSVHDSFFLGAMLLAAVFNFFFFLIVRERMYLYFALYVFFLGFGRFNIEAEFYHLFLREHPVIYKYLFNNIWFPADFFLAIFIRSLLGIKKIHPRWDKFIFYWTLFYAVSYVVSEVIANSLVGTNMADYIDFGSSFIVIGLHVILVITLFLFLKQDNSFNRRFLIAILPAFTIWAFGVDATHLSDQLLYGFNVPRSGFMAWLRQNWYLIETICLFWQVLCFSWFLFHYFVELRKQVVQKELEKEIEKSQLIAQQKVELEKQVTERTSELKQSLENLKSTQAQLIQSEKMASLGELTAGIAHEIQNPLNFVNNFSEVNKEMLEELKAERLKQEVERDDSLEEELINGVIDNEEKINFHGKRADAIVKGMLQHSRSSTGVKQLTDINALADEYLRLSFHGLRAKDKNFNAEIKTDFDGSIGKINVVPQDIGRVLLNLYNNAFYAVNEQKSRNLISYQPTVWVSTTKEENRVVITVSDNGGGIAEKVKDKIFQPFFTTKPTGQGTGLGLSLSYDIVKAHGGEIKVQSKEGEGTTFIIQLPI